MPTDKLKITFYADNDVAEALKDLGPGERSRRINELIRRGMEYSEEATDKMLNIIRNNTNDMHELGKRVEALGRAQQTREDQWLEQKRLLGEAITELQQSVAKVSQQRSSQQNLNDKDKKSS